MTPQHAAPKASELDPTVAGGSSTKSATPMRADIQGLRALAVTLVVIFHLWPARLGGGYVGVDVFFVISGYLITSHLWREAAATGKVRLGQFWARRVRRLLPASLFVLLASVALVWWTVPSSLWTQFMREVGASALYIQNWALADDAVDYLAASNTASPVQHYWSLSVEEQFYLVWPLIIVAAMWLGRRIVRADARRAVFATLGVICAASLAYSIAVTAADPAAAYFVTPARAWEFGAGALLAFVPALKLRRAGVLLTAWVGVAMIVGSALWMTRSTPFPGWWALIPVVGTALVIWADAPASRGGFTWAVSPRLVQWVGTLSYSIYLWHWPLIVIWPFASGHDLTTPEKIAIGAITLVLSWLTWRFIENPGRTARFLTRGPTWRTFAAMLAGMALVVGSAWALTQSVTRAVERSETIARELEERPDPCFGAAVMDPDRGECAEDPVFADAIIPTPAGADADQPPPCLASKQRDGVRICEFGEPEETATETVVLLGDSHAYHWRPPVQRMAKERGWHVLAIARESCPFTLEKRRLDDGVIERCSTWNEEVRELLEGRPDISRVFLSQYSASVFQTEQGEDAYTVAVDGFAETLAFFPSTVTSIYVLRDPPQPLPDNVDCVDALPTLEQQLNPVACSVTRAKGLHDDALIDAVPTQDRALAIDLSDFFCEADLCKPVIGHAMVYADHGHLTRTFSLSLQPFIESAIDDFEAGRAATAGES